MKKKTLLLLATSATIVATTGTVMLSKSFSANISNAGEVLKTITISGTKNVIPNENYGDYHTQTLYNDDGTEVGSFGYRFQDYRDGWKFGGESIFSGTQYSYSGWRPSFKFEVSGLRKIEWGISQSTPTTYRLYFNNGISSIYQDQSTYEAPEHGDITVDSSISAYSTSQEFFFFFPKETLFSIDFIVLTYSYSECLGI